MQLIREREQSGEWNFDYVFLTDDLTRDEQLAMYEAQRGLLGDWSPRCRLIPGNHDDRALMRKVFPELVSSSTEFINSSVRNLDPLKIIPGFQ